VSACDGSIEGVGGDDGVDVFADLAHPSVADIEAEDVTIPVGFPLGMIMSPRCSMKIRLPSPTIDISTSCAAAVLIPEPLVLRQKRHNLGPA
jgi:hypothetical protein